MSPQLLLFGRVGINLCSQRVLLKNKKGVRASERALVFTPLHTFLLSAAAAAASRLCATHHAAPIHCPKCAPSHWPRAYSDT